MSEASSGATTTTTTTTTTKSLPVPRFLARIEYIQTSKVGAPSLTVWANDKLGKQHERRYHTGPETYIRAVLLVGTSGPGVFDPAVLSSPTVVSCVVRLFLPCDTFFILRHSSTSAAISFVPRGVGLILWEDSPHSALL